MFLCVRLIVMHVLDYRELIMYFTVNDENIYARSGESDIDGGDQSDAIESDCKEAPLENIPNERSVNGDSVVTPKKTSVSTSVGTDAPIEDVVVETNKASEANVVKNITTISTGTSPLPQDMSTQV